MRDKFSELIKDGVASFNYTPITSGTPNTDPICRIYNNIFSIATDTHMSIAEDGSRIITGSAVGRDKWECYYLYTNNVGGYVFPKDIWSISCFLCKYGLYGVKETFNGDVVYKIIDCPRSEEGTCPMCPKCCHIPESNIPERLSVLTTTGMEVFVQECFNKASNKQEVVEHLNNSPYIKGEWILYGDKIAGNVNNKVYIL